MEKTKRMPLQTRRPVARPRQFPPRRNFTSLSVRDLLDARDAYHVHLSMLDNVVATAIGRYLIHEKDWYARYPPGQPRQEPKVTEARTLENSVLRPWSWPAVLVFVRQWEQPEVLGAELVPQKLYLPDGRVVPTCVIQATPDESLPPPTMGPFHSSPLLGGGYSCLREHQGEQSTGTIACLVRKAGSYYALTNRHVAGGEGEDVRALVRGEYLRIGKTSNYAVDRLLVSAAFAGWPGDRSYLTLDAGLIRIDDLDDWTSQAFGIGEIGEVFDATPQAVTLDLIGCPLRAFGGTSGVMEGEIRALFFRYQSLGGFDYATDLLIGPRRDDSPRRGGPNEPPLTRPGDSGTLWFYDPPSTPDESSRAVDTDDDADQSEQPPERGARARRLRPIAMQWGGQRTIQADRSKRSAFALASFLSSICRSLDVEVVRNWSTGHDEYWGRIGHFAIGWKACDEVSGKLATLMQKNQPRIGFGNGTLGEGSQFTVGRGEYVPLADVPDYVWVFPREHESVQHFADIDIHDITGGPTLLQRCIDDPANVSASVWKTYFDGFAAETVGPEEGVLPFRVWQIWNEMVRHVQDGGLLRFVAAAGILAHYVGDASQPLHSSFLHHGRPPTRTVNGREYPFPHDSDEFQAFKDSRAAKIHAIYEQDMFEVDAAAALTAVDDELAIDVAAPTINSGHDAAVETVRLMAAAQQTLPPTTIIDADDPALTPKKRATRLWNNDEIRTPTIELVAASVRLLAALWTSAWVRGGGNNIPESQLVEFTEQELEDLYRGTPAFLPSLSLADMVQGGGFEAP